MKVESTFIYLHGLRFHAPIGVLDQEKIVGNDIAIDLRIGFPYEKALRSDDVADTLNYAEVYDIIRREVSQPVNLLEGLAGKIANKLQLSFQKITSIDMRITKLNPPMGADSEGAGVEIHLINTKTEE